MAGIPGEDPMVLPSFLLLGNVDSSIAITMNLCACYGSQAEESQLQNDNVFMTYSQIKSCSGTGMLSINSRTMVPFFYLACGIAHIWVHSLSPLIPSACCLLLECAFMWELCISISSMYCREHNICLPALHYQ